MHTAAQAERVAGKILSPKVSKNIEGTLGGKGASKLTGPQWKFPENPADLLKELPRDGRGRIYTSDNLRIRPEKHALKPDEIFNPRHHGQHYHVESRINPSLSWNNKGNAIQIKPKGYELGSGTGFLPGEYFPGSTIIE